jgi:mutual gliding-motility protein MglA
MRHAITIVAALVGLAATARASFINYSSREINCKIVYYGPAAAGLRENLAYIYDKTAPGAKGKMITLSTETEKTVFFDFLPLSLGEIRGFKVRFHLYTVPGKVLYNASRLLILKGADGVVFVAPSDPAQVEATLQAWESLKANLAEHGFDWKKMPIVVQLDGRDHPKAVPIEFMRKLLALPDTMHLFEATSKTGAGVFDTLKDIAKLILMELKAGAEKK